ERQHDGEGTDQRHRYGDDGNERGAQVAQEDENHDRHQHERLDQRVDHALDRGLDEHRGVVHDIVGDIVGKARLEVVDRLAHTLRGGQRIGAGQLVDLDAGRGLAVVAADRIAALGAELDAGDVLDAHQGAVALGAYNDVLELVDRRQAALGGDVELEADILEQGRGAD